MIPVETKEAYRNTAQTAVIITHAKITIAVLLAHIKNVREIIFTGTTHAVTNRALRSTATTDAITIPARIITQVFALKIHIKDVAEIICTGMIPAETSKVHHNIAPMDAIITLA